MAKLTPVQAALHALRWNLPRGELPTAAQLKVTGSSLTGSGRRPWAGELVGLRRRGGSFRPLAGTGLRW
jgi:hypothetical protein